MFIIFYYKCDNELHVFSTYTLHNDLLLPTLRCQICVAWGKSFCCSNKNRWVQIYLVYRSCRLNSNSQVTVKTTSQIWRVKNVYFGSTIIKFILFILSSRLIVALCYSSSSIVISNTITSITCLNWILSKQTYFVSFYDGSTVSI